MAGDLANKISLVTGGARGIGRATVKALAREGAFPIFTDILEQEAAVLLTELERDGRKGYFIHLDSADQEAILRAVGDIVNQFGRIDILVNNAGIAPKKNGGIVPLAEMTVEEWDRVLKVNLYGTFYFTRAVVPLMISQRSGKIVNLSSRAARSPNAINSCHYVASKAGILGFTKAVGRELAPYGINVNAVCPGRIETGLSTGATSEAMNEFLLRDIPMGRCGKAEEVAEVILFLCSEQARYIAGEGIFISGGRF